MVFIKIKEMRYSVDSSGSPTYAQDEFSQIINLNDVFKIKKAKKAKNNKYTLIELNNGEAFTIGKTPEETELAIKNAVSVVDLC